jgi:hypothetical protein
MSRSNYDKLFYVDVGTSMVAVRCASNHDVIVEYDHSRHPFAIELAKTACDRMNKEAEISRPRRNCDVGDAADWEKRFGEECDKGHKCSDCPVGHAKKEMAIKLDKGARCEFAWAQMPYEEGGDK